MTLWNIVCKSIINVILISGRSYYGMFLDLPDRAKYPDYYEVVKTPISLNMVEVERQR